MKPSRGEAYARLKSRRNPEGDRTLFEAFEGLQESDAVKYLAGAMEPIPAAYTIKTQEEASRVENQIKDGLAAKALTAEYRLQGSVVKNTHIKGYSDVDLLVIESRFISLEPPQKAGQPYEGEPVEDLLELRRIIVEKLKARFYEATVDESGPKSIKISGGSLRRTVDVVPANWYNTNDYVATQNEVLRGIHILNAFEKKRHADQPFLHGAWLADQEAKTNGNSKKIIRLLKSIKYDSDVVDPMSSYDIEALVFRMDEAELQKWGRGQELQLAFAAYQWLYRMDEDSARRGQLRTPDGKREIFGAGHATQQQLRALLRDFGELLNEVQEGLATTARRLSEARLKYPERHSIWS